MSKIHIRRASCYYEKEPLKTAFGFKGNALTCTWQTVVRLETDQDAGIGLGIQSVLWSDAAVFQKLGEEDGNRAMFKATEYAAKLCENIAVETPFELMDILLPKVLAYAKGLIGVEHLRTTFALNALVPIDFAMWQLWAKENGKQNFDELAPFDGQHQKILANIPLITYSTPLKAVRTMAESGIALFKIKIGSDPLKNNDPTEMLLWDQNRILEIHQTVKDIVTPYTKTGKILYYLDANGRYDSKERLNALISFADEHGFLDRIVLLEEPFDEDNKIDVGDLPICIAADESTHSAEDVQERIALGYKALALKPIAKTLSMTIRMWEHARRHGIICFCADLTVNPIMVSWNQCVAARLNPIPKMNVGVIESNGEQNYVNWEKMLCHHPWYGERFTKCEDGIFYLGDRFYETNGGVFELPKYFDRYLHKKEVHEWRNSGLVF